MENFINRVKQIPVTERIERLKEQTLTEPRYLTVEQARIITRVYKEYSEESVAMKRARALKAAAEELELRIDEGELIVGNRSRESCGGVVFPEGGTSGWRMRSTFWRPDPRISSMCARRIGSTFSGSWYPSGRA